MKLIELFENEREEWEALAKTGFYGKRGAGVLFFAEDTERFLIAKRSSQVEEPHTWGTWGGAISNDEKPVDGARREAHEETGYSGAMKFKLLWVFKHKSGFEYHNFLAIVSKEFTPKLNWESEDFAWVSLGDWPSPLHPGMKALLSANVPLVAK